MLNCPHGLEVEYKEKQMLAMQQGQMNQTPQNQQKTITNGASDCIQDLEDVLNLLSKKFKNIDLYNFIYVEICIQVT